MSKIEVRNQSELDAALKKAKPTDWIVCVGDGRFEIYGSAKVRAYDSAQVRASDSAQLSCSWVTAPMDTSVSPKRSPLARCRATASSTSWGVTSPRLTRISASDSGWLTR